MDPKSFVYLHNHSHYSLLEALPKPKNLVKRAKELGMTAIALTDNGSLYGAVEFFKACKDAEMHAIIGMDAFIAPYRMTDRRPRVDERAFRLVLLVKDDEGYRNLLAITTAGFLEGFYYKPRVDKQFLREHAKGLIALSGSVNNDIASALLSDDIDKAKALVAEYQEIFGIDNFYLEIIHHPDMPRQMEVNEAYKKLSVECGVPLVAGRNTFYLEPDDREGYEAQLCIQRSRTLEEFRRTAIDDVDLSFGTPEETIAYFADVPEALENTTRIAERCTYSMELGKNYLPVFPLPPGKTDNEFMRALCIEGLKSRYADPIPDAVMERFDFEYATIMKMGFASYFLIVSDYITWAKDNGVLVGPGRGSAAGSIVAFALRITDIEPLRYGLLFQRFMNPDRLSMPDSDTDFADRWRGKVLEYITQKYGVDHCAGIITFGTLMPRAAIRDASRVLGLSFQEADVIAKAVPPPVQGKHTPLKEAIVESPDLHRIYEGDPIARRVIDLAMKLEGNPRHASQHACGIVIGDRPLVERAPLQQGQHEDMAFITQYSLNSAEAVGLVKMDFLGLSNLTIIEDALEIIRAVHGVTIDINTIPLDDKKTFELLGRGETTGVFQLESDGMKRYIRDLQPTMFEDIIAMVSLYRPGPMQFIETFINRKHGRERVVYEHPLMENAFKETYGIPVYQEQVMQVSKDLAGFTGGEADTLRKAMGKKIAELMAKMKTKFVEGAMKNGVREAVAEKIFQKLEDFAAYGFNKSHAACYALIAYRTAYLKAYYPAEFMCALMNSDSGNLDRITIEVAECGRMGMQVLPPDVNESFPGFAVVPGTRNIRWGLQAIKNVGTEIAELMVKERKKGGEFVDLADFLGRIHANTFNKKTLEALVKTGACDRFNDRATLFSNLDQLLLYNKHINNSRDKNQTSLFDLAPTMVEAKISLRAAPDISRSEILGWEKELLGMYVSTHPGVIFAEAFLGKVKTCTELQLEDDGNGVTVAGVIGTVKQIFTKKKNEPMAFVRLEDATGGIEMVVFPKAYAKMREKLVPDTLVLIKGSVSVREARRSFTPGTDIDAADDAEPTAQPALERSILCDALVAFKESEVPQLAQLLQAGGWPDEASQSEARSAQLDADGIVITAPEKPSQEMIGQLRDIFRSAPGRERVYLLVNSGGTMQKIATEFTVVRNRDVMERIATIVGAGNVR
ncbi:MAG: DNA polymerase III subunit alpha [Patescibacteria group bacterium]